METQGTIAPEKPSAPETVDRFAGLFELAKTKGSKRTDLLTRINVRLAANLKVNDAPNYLRLTGMLQGWLGLSDFKAAVRRQMGESKDKRAKEKAEKEAAERLESAEAAGLEFIPEGNPVQIAQDFLMRRRPHLMYYDSTWLDHQVNHYRAVEHNAVRASLQNYMASGVNAETGEPTNINRHDLDNVVDALRNIVLREVSPDNPEPPAWLNPEPGDPDPKLVIACRNGLLNVLTGEMIPNTPRFFTRNGLPYDYVEPWECDRPHHLLAFLESVWPVDEGGQENHDALQEIIGHLLTGETKYQKIFTLTGPTRAGKGVIVRLISALLGKGNIHSMSVEKLGKDFGVKALIGKQVFIVPDLRVGKNANIAGIIEMLLNMSGEDDVSVGRKFEDDKQTKLNTRAFLVGNAETAFPDQSGALTARYHGLVMKKTFAGGKEDNTLDAKLQSELPEILLWALAGLRRLEARRDPTSGRQLGFVSTTSGRAMLADIKRKGSPVQSFITECCDMGKGSAIPKAELFKAFEGWAHTNEVAAYHTPETFSKELRVASGYNVESARPNIDGARVRQYIGIALKPEFVTYDWDEEGSDS